MSHGKQFTLYNHAAGPNGWKAVFVLEELGLTYETIYLDFKSGDLKKESDAIILYIVDKYDTEKKLTVTDADERYRLIQWLFFQASGQGPYFGQYFWFKNYHPEKVESARDRYKSEIARVRGVLESVLSKQEWLVEGKVTIADLSFIPWNESVISGVLQGEDVSIDQFPAVAAWRQKLLALDAVKKGYAERTRARTLIRVTVYYPLTLLVGSQLYR
ncbi:hypothetical protein QCA50_005307 [Cerrena zonata]|uniref:GST C-terminal domain-containing protein n=1 Tax=Cerrena zonata TaxID=2478898 RepID=A0AAW0GPS0_9APHY